MNTTVAVPAKKSLDQIEADEFALGSLLEEIGGDVSDPEIEASIDAWFSELAEERERKLIGYAGLIRSLRATAAAKKAYAAEQKEFIADVSAAAKAAERRVDFLERRLLRYLADQRLAELQAGPFTFKRQGNGGKQALRYLAAPLQLPESLRVDVVTIRVGSNQDFFFAELEAWIARFFEDEGIVVERAAQPIEDEVRSAIARGEAARAERGAEDPPLPDEQIFRYAFAEPRGARLAIK